MASRLRLLLVSRKFYRDCKPIFYGWNHFKFTNRSGWIALGIFLRSLTSENRSLLRYITARFPTFNFSIYHPERVFFGILRLKGACDETCQGSGVLHHRPRCFGSPYAYDERVFGLLEGIPKLRRLSLVVPCLPHPFSWWLWQPAHILLFTDYTVSRGMPIVLTAQRCKTGKCHFEGADVAAGVVAAHNLDWANKGQRKWELAEIPTPPSSRWSLSRLFKHRDWLHNV